MLVVSTNFAKMSVGKREYGFQNYFKI